MEELEGKRAAVAPASTMAFAPKAAIGINKLDGASIKRPPSLQPDTIAAWSRADIDATCINGRFWRELRNNGGRQLLVSKDLQKDSVFIRNGAVVRTESADRSPNTIVAWLRTVQKQSERYKTAPEDVLKVLAAHYGAPFEAVRDTLASLDYPSFQ